MAIATWHNKCVGGRRGHGEGNGTMTKATRSQLTQTIISKLSHEDTGPIDHIIVECAEFVTAEFAREYASSSDRKWITNNMSNSGLINELVRHAADRVLISILA